FHVTGVQTCALPISGELDSRKLKHLTIMNKVHYRLFLSWLFLLLAGCRAYQEKSKAESKSLNSSANGDYLHQDFLEQHTDTYSALWIYQTDSSFRFHPDSGLFGNAGLLQIYAYGQQTGLINASWDSLSFNRQMLVTEQADQSLKKEPVKQFSFWGVIIFVLAGLVCLLVWHRLSRSRR